MYLFIYIIKKLKNENLVCIKGLIYIQEFFLTLTFSISISVLKLNNERAMPL